jgi:hypothetical protein
MSTALSRDAILVHVVDSAFNRHARVETLIEAYENKTQHGGHADGYESRDAVDAHSYDITGAAGSVHYVAKLVSFRSTN